MIDTSVTYAGLTLKNPLIVGSCGLTNSIESLKKLESNGAAAVVLKSIFEEQILRQADYEVAEAQKNEFLYSQYSDSLDYIDQYIKEDTIVSYLAFIQQAKKELLIPVIASINCVSSYEWSRFAKRIQDAGADAIELNIFLHASDESDTDFEKTYFDIIAQAKKHLTIPVTVKMTHNFTKLSQSIQAISKTGIKGLVLFNRFNATDIDIETMKVAPKQPYSNPQEYILPLQWIGLNAKKVSCDLVASTGIHSGETAIKQILAGATAVQVVSALYKNGPEYIQTMLQDIEKWMERKGFNYVSQFKGMLSAANNNPAAYERIQFMKYFSQIDK
ncbi:MAG: dihydroorotate dehydrogenase-like protein [Bacteroidales bacterium]|nr:dihydroorotate dehydrogenase-like protein [Bacteroidales bacterium]NLK81087.1 dihydroorotate dehydrogenase-like protein [Bacteroidales bacterium]HPY82129.1 dihydroorotate dehydrogenase-like protein [Bacteroidales bacterium]